MRNKSKTKIPTPPSPPLPQAQPHSFTPKSSASCLGWGMGGWGQHCCSFLLTPSPWLHHGLPQPAGHACSTVALSIGYWWYLVHHGQRHLQHTLTLLLLWPWPSPCCAHSPPSPHSSACVAFLPLSSVSFPRDTTTNTDRLSCAPVGLLKPAGTTCILQPYPVLTVATAISTHQHSLA